MSWSRYTDLSHRPTVPANGGRPKVPLLAYISGVKPDMWRLASFRFDDGIESPLVYIYEEELGELPRGVAIDVAHSRGVNLVAEWPEDFDSETPFCFFGKVSLPLRWERIPEEPGRNPSY